MRRWMALGITLVAVSAALPAGSHAQTVATVSQMAPRIVMLIPANAFRDEEFDLPYKHFCSHATVVVASTKLGQITGMMGHKAEAGMLVKNIDVGWLDALVLVGGIGARQYWWDPTVHNLIRQTVAQKKVLAAICISPVTLAYAGVLKGKRATVFVSERGRLIEKGAKYTGKELTIDGLIITASGPKSAQMFAEKVLNLVIEEQKRRQDAMETIDSNKPNSHGANGAEDTTETQNREKAVG